jgi:ABC-type Fe3+ transport system permease subunit
MVNTIDFVALCIVPLVIIVILSGTTARRIIHSIVDMSGETEGKQKVMQARLLSTNILISLAVVFAVCYVPYFLYAFLNAWFALDVDNSTHDLINLFTFSLIFANSCFNPIAVYLASRRYRTHMNRYLLCKCRQQVVKENWKISAETSITPEAQL